MPSVVPCLMFVGEQCGRAEEAVELYVSLFEGSSIESIERWPDGAGESGVKQAHFTLAGQRAIAMDSAAPHQFTFTPAISLVVECDAAGELDSAWERLSDGAKVLMPLQAYDFSPRFGWLNDRFGVSWQLKLG